MSCQCFIVPPHLLKAIATSTHNDEAIRKSAQKCVDFHEKLTTARRERVATLTQPRGKGPSRVSPFVPQILLQQISKAKAVDDTLRSLAEKDLAHAQQLMKPNKGTLAVIHVTAIMVFLGTNRIE